MMPWGLVWPLVYRAFPGVAMLFLLARWLRSSFLTGRSPGLGRTSALAFWLGISGCATWVPVKVLRPAEVNLKGINKIAIGEISGPESHSLVEELRSKLFDTKRYELVEREKLDAILKEQNLSMSDLADEGSAAKLGKILGAAAVLVGSVTLNDYGEHVSKETTESENPKTKAKESHTTYTRTGVAKVQVSLRIVDASTGKVLATKTPKAERSAATSKTDDPEPDPIDREALLSSARTEVIMAFLKMIAPYEEIVRLPFETTGDLPRLEQGVNFAKIGQWPQAIAAFTESVKTADSDPRLAGKKQAYAHLNLGLALCYSGDFDAGLAELTKAFAMKGDPDWGAQLKECERMKTDRRKLEEQARDAAPPPPAPPPQAAAPAEAKAEPDLPAGPAELKTLCAKKEARACFQLARMYSAGNGVSRSKSKAAVFFNLACSAGSGIGCYRLGIMYEEGCCGRGNASKAPALLKRSCELGEKQACQ